MVSSLASLRFFDARHALLIPAGGGALLISSATPPDPFFTPLLGPALDRVSLAPGDLDPYFEVFPAPPEDLETASLGAVSALPPPGAPVQTDNGPLATPVNLGNAVEFLGWQLLAPDPLTLVTFWRVSDPAAVGPPVPPAYKTDAAFFLHVLDPSGEIIAQQDTLDAPSWQWQPGDLVIQIHRVPRPPGPPALPPPDTLALGLYNRADGSRLTVLDPDGHPHGDRLLLSLPAP